MKYYKDKSNQLFVDPIVENHTGLVKITKSEFNTMLLPSISELQTAKVNELGIAYNDANELDIAYMKTTFQADKGSQDLIVSVLSAGSVPTGFFWLDKANNQVPMTYAALQGLSGAILARNQTNFVKFQTLKAKVSTAKTQADLDLIVW